MGEIDIMRCSIAALTIPLFVLGGCASISETVKEMEASYENYQFNRSVEKSRFWALEASALLKEGKTEKAKQLLDDAFLEFQDHVALHQRYEEYYTLTNNHKMAAIAKARAEKMKERSQRVNHKGRLAMEKFDAYETADELFSLALIYWASNTSALQNMATLAYVTHDTALGLACLEQLQSLGHKTPESVMLSYLFAEREGDTSKMGIAKLEMSVLFKDTPQYAFINNGNILANT